MHHSAPDCNPIQVDYVAVPEVKPNFAFFDKNADDVKEIADFGNLQQ